MLFVLIGESESIETSVSFCVWVVKVSSIKGNSFFEIVSGDSSNEVVSFIIIRVSDVFSFVFSEIESKGV